MRATEITPQLYTNFQIKIRQTSTLKINMHKLKIFFVSSLFSCYNARLANIKPKFVSSSFVSSSKEGRVAQSVEQRIENPRVASSILAPATI